MTALLRVVLVISAAIALVGCAGDKEATLPEKTSGATVTTLTSPSAPLREAIPTEIALSAPNLLWIRSLKEPYLWLQEGVAGVPKPVALEQPVSEIVVGTRHAWAIGTDARTSRTQAVLVDSSARITRTVPLPQGCELASGVSREENLWVFCGESLLRIGSGGVTDTGISGRAAPLLATTDGVWLATRDGLRPLTGAFRGQLIPLHHPGAVEWVAFRTTAWALDESDGGSVLVRVDLSTGDETVYPIRTGPSFPLKLDVAGEDAWVATDSGALLRFRPRESAAALQEVNLAPRDDSSIVDLAADATGVWALVLSDDVELVRVEK